MPTLTLTGAAIGHQDFGTGLDTTEERDPVSAAFVAAGDAFAVDYVQSGVDVITGFQDGDHGEFDLTAGTVIVSIDADEFDLAVQTGPGDADTYDVEWNGAVAVPVSVPPTGANLALEDGDNDVYLVIDPTANNAVTVEWGTNVSPTDPALLVATIDTNTETVTPASRAPDLEAGVFVAESIDADELTIDGQAVATEAYADETGFSGSYTDLTNVPSTFAPEDHGNDAHTEPFAIEGVTDASAFTGGSGTDGQLLQTDGTATLWATVETGGMETHDLGGEFHDPDTLANLNELVSDATLDDSSDERPPESHALDAHTAATLAALNGIVSDATLDDAGDTRPPDNHDNTAHTVDFADVAANETVTGGWTFEDDLVLPHPTELNREMEIGHGDGDMLHHHEPEQGIHFFGRSGVYYSDTALKTVVHRASQVMGVAITNETGELANFETGGAEITTGLDVGGDIDIDGDLRILDNRTIQYGGTVVYMGDIAGTNRQVNIRADSRDQLRVHSHHVEVNDDLDVTGDITAGSDAVPTTDASGLRVEIDEGNGIVNFVTN